MPPETAIRFRVDHTNAARARQTPRRRKPSTSPRGCADVVHQALQRRIPRLGERRRLGTRPARRADRARRQLGTRPAETAGRRDGRPASSTRAGAPCSKASRWPTCPRAISCAARRSSSPTDGATPGPRPSRTSSVEPTRRSWSPIPAGRAAGEATRTGRSVSGGRRSR